MKLCQTHHATKIHKTPLAPKLAQARVPDGVVRGLLGWHGSRVKALVGPSSHVEPCTKS